MNQRVQELFHQLADLPPAERARYLADHTIDESTRREVQELLAFDVSESSPLLRDLSGVAGQTIAQIYSMGQRCGPFRLVSMLGRGGMGVVYLAERVDGEVNQRVAVKLLRPGVLDFQRERFLQERQILAELAHPHIARLLDAGHLEDGQPFLVMEYVDGQAIDEYAAQLTHAQKIRLFLKVCGAVAYLHRNLVVHRDLKPGNILVTQDGEPKILDFGIAKIVGLANPIVTEIQMLTPDYASPEQVMGVPIGTTSDIYSLGAVLYELLTGHKPHRFDDTSPGAVYIAISSREITRPSKLMPGLEADAEAIVMKALRKEPSERYQTVEQLSEDLEAYLESRPIRARQGDLAYRARKFARRYWLPVAAAALTVTGLTAGLLIANHQRAIAQRRFAEVRQLSNKLFEIDVQVRRLAGSTQARQFIVDTSLEYLSRLAKDASDDPDLSLDLGTAYMRVARVQGVPINTNLGQMDQAEQTLQSAERLISSVLAAQPNNRKAYLRAAQIAHDRMVLAEYRHPPDGALALARKSEQWLNRYLETGPVDSARIEAEGAVIVAMNVANWYVRTEDTEDALRLLRRTVEIAKATNQPRQAGAAQIVVARALRSKGDLDGALAAIREGVSLLESKQSQDGVGQVSTLGVALSMQGQILGEDSAVSLGRPKEAAVFLERAYDIALDGARRDPNDAESRLRTGAAGYRLASVLRHWDPARSLEVFDEVLRRLGEVKNNSRARVDIVKALAGSSDPLVKLGRLDEARRRLDLAFQRLKEDKIYPSKEVELGADGDMTLRALAEFEAATGNVEGGLQTYRTLLDKLIASKPEPEKNLADAADLSDVYTAIATLYRRANHPSEAGELDARRLALWTTWDRKLPNNPFVIRQLASVAKSPARSGPAVP
jgi:tetratricopeptide (TPR) repeat protein/predicted Ser/Thr protein kinase